MVIKSFYLKPNVESTILNYFELYYIIVNTQALVVKPPPTNNGLEYRFQTNHSKIIDFVIIKKIYVKMGRNVSCCVVYGFTLFVF